jgi:hypothetical protein
MVSTNIVTDNGTTNIAITNDVHLFHRGREREGVWTWSRVVA